MDENRQGPQRSWLARIGKAADEGCQCGHSLQDGDHIVFSCPRFRNERKDLLGHRTGWEGLDDPNWRNDEGDDSHWDTIESFFDFIFSEFS